MNPVHIVIRYYDAEGELVYEDEATLEHRYRVPLGWVRWEIYWGEVKVQSGERASPRPTPAERRGGGRHR